MGMQLKRLLSKKDLAILTGIIFKNLSCAGEESLRGLLLDVRQLIQSEYVMCLMGDRAPGGGLGTFDIINANYPYEWFERYFARKYCKIDPIIKENFDSFAVQYWADTYKKHNPPKDFIMLAEDFCLANGYTYGIKHSTGTKGSLFSFAGNSIERHVRNETILKHIIPHLHQSLMRILKPADKKRPLSLSIRENEVLIWLKEGKSSWDISRILRVSERTVNFHIENIMRKLDAVNRTHAVAIALEQRLIDFD